MYIENIVIIKRQTLIIKYLLLSINYTIRDFDANNQEIYLKF